MAGLTAAMNVEDFAAVSFMDKDHEPASAKALLGARITSLSLATPQPSALSFSKENSTERGAGTGAAAALVPPTTGFVRGLSPFGGTVLGFAPGVSPPGAPL